MNQTNSYYLCPLYFMLFAPKDNYLAQLILPSNKLSHPVNLANSYFFPSKYAGDIVFIHQLIQFGDIYLYYLVYPLNKYL